MRAKRGSIVFFLLTLTLFACAGRPLNQSRVQERVPQTAQEYFERGYARLGEDDYQGAIPAFTRAIELDPANPRYYRARAGVYRVLENNEGALTDYTAAIELTPPSELARTSLFQKSLYELRAAVRKELQDYRGAAEDLTKLIDLNPESFRVYVQRAEIRELEGNMDAAIEDVTRAIELGQSPFLYSRRAKLREKNGDVDGAIADCMRALQADPGNPLCSRFLAQWGRKKEPQIVGSQPAQPRTTAMTQERSPEKKKAEGAPPGVKGPKAEVSPKMAKRAEARPETAKPAETLAKAEKPTPEPLAKVAKPRVKTKIEYSVQVATLVLERNVLALKERLEKLGYSPIIRKTTARIPRHRVFGGEFSSREEVEQTARRLNVDGFPSKLVNIEGGKFRLEVGSFLRLNEAIDVAHRLQKKNYTAKIVSKAAFTPVHQVRVGKYENRPEALKALEVLKKKGFAPLIVKR